jgi:hypothetical protein
MSISRPYLQARSTGWRSLPAGEVYRLARSTGWPNLSANQNHISLLQYLRAAFDLILVAKCSGANLYHELG